MLLRYHFYDYHDSCTTESNVHGVSLRVKEPLKLMTAISFFGPLSLLTGHQSPGNAWFLNLYCLIERIATNTVENIQPSTGNVRTTGSHWGTPFFHTLRAGAENNLGGEINLRIQRASATNQQVINKIPPQMPNAFVFLSLSLFFNHYSPWHES